MADSSSDSESLEELAEAFVARFRAGERPSLAEFTAAHPELGGAVLSWLWLALAQQCLGKAEEARGWLIKAQGWLDQYRNGIPARTTSTRGCTCTTGWKSTSFAARRNP